MELISERLHYRKFLAADFAAYLGLATDESVMHYITGRALTREEARTRFDSYLKTNEQQAEAGFFAVSTTADGVFIGLAKFVYTTDWQAEVGYSLLPAFWGRRYTSELVSCLLNHATTIPRLTQLIALVDPANAVSIRVLTKHLFSLAPQKNKSHSSAPLWYQVDRPFNRQ